MPWQEESVVSQRKRLVESCLMPNANKREVFRRFGVSAKTGYKWLKRYEEKGLCGLEGESKKPHHQPGRTNKSVEEEVVLAHDRYPYWGPEKLKRYLIQVEGLSGIPSHTTIRRILGRHGRKVIRSDRGTGVYKRFERSQPNELWQMDFKGSFLLGNQVRCYPLSILDDYSRFGLGLEACTDERGKTVKEQLTDRFRRYGMPLQINVDNGNPWGSADLESSTSFQVWLMKCGVTLTHSSPFHPQTNGKCERFHRTIKLEVLHRKRYWDVEEIQEAFDEWLHIYNFSRPHQACNHLPPASRYTESPRAFPETLKPVEYDIGEVTSLVEANTGRIWFQGKRFRVGRGFCGERVAIRETDEDGVYVVFFMDSMIKRISMKKNGG